IDQVLIFFWRFVRRDQARIVDDSPRRCVNENSFSGENLLHIFAYPGKDAGQIRFLQNILFLQMGELPQRAEINISGRFAAGFVLRDHPCGHRINLRTGRKKNPAVESELFVEGGFYFRKSFFPAKGSRTGNEIKFALFLRVGNQILEPLRGPQRKRQNQKQRENYKSAGANHPGAAHSYTPLLAKTVSGKSHFFSGRPSESACNSRSQIFLMRMIAASDRPRRSMLRSGIAPCPSWATWSWMFTM